MNKILICLKCLVSPNFLRLEAPGNKSLIFQPYLPLSQYSLQSGPLSFKNLKLVSASGPLHLPSSLPASSPSWLHLLPQVSGSMSLLGETLPDHPAKPTPPCFSNMIHYFLFSSQITIWMYMCIYLCLLSPREVNSTRVKSLSVCWLLCAPVSRSEPGTCQEHLLKEFTNRDLPSSLYPHDLLQEEHSSSSRGSPPKVSGADGNTDSLSQVTKLPFWAQDGKRGARNGIGVGPYLPGSLTTPLPHQPTRKHEAAEDK